MAALFRDLGLGASKRREALPISATDASVPRSPPVDLPSPYGQLSVDLSDADLRVAAYEIFVAACRTSSGKPLTYIRQSDVDRSPSPSPSPNSSSSPSLQRSLTSTASRMKKALGMKSLSPVSKKSPLSSSREGSPLEKQKKPVTIGELMRVQMRVSETVDSRIRRALLRIAAGQVGKRIESVVIPLELLQQLKFSDFSDQKEFEGWQRRNLRLLEAGLVLHPRKPLEKSDIAAQRLRQIIRAALDRPIETGKNNESMQVLRSAVISLACRSYDDSCHWADGFPLNLLLYQMMLEACFDTNDETSIIEEVDELLELIKKTWGVLGLNQMLHNLSFSWILFHRFVATGQVENDLLQAADSQLAEVTNDVKMAKDPDYSRILSSTLSSMLGWAEKRLLAYHDTFDSGNIDSMQSIVSLGVSAAKILVEDISNEYRRRRKGEVDVAHSRTETYIRSSLRTAFAQRMERADSSRRASKSQLPVLAILAKDVGELAVKEKDMFSPILRRWHPFAAGVAVATLHACYGNEIKQFISGITELTPDAVQVLRAADKLEKNLVQIAVEDSVDSDDGGKAIIREMPPYEAETAITNLVKVWIKSRINRLKEWADRNIQQELWNSRANKEGMAPSAVEMLLMIDETLNAFFQLPIPMHPALLPDLVTSLDKCLQYYITKATSGCGTRNAFIPSMPALTRCSAGSKFQGVFKKKEKLQVSNRRNSQVATVNGDSCFGTPQLCVRINTLYRIKIELDSVEKRIVTLLRNSESAQANDISNGLSKKFDLSPAAATEGIQHLCEAVAYKILFHDLSHVLWDSLYVGAASSSRIDPLLQELEQSLVTVSDAVNETARMRVVTEIMKAAFDGFLLVLLAGGPSRAFTQQDSRVIEEDFEALKALFWANGDGVAGEVVDRVAGTVRGVLGLLRADTGGLVERFRRVTIEAYGSSAKSRLPLPPTTGLWGPNEANTLLRVLCYRNDEAASKFLKKTYNLPKKL